MVALLSACCSGSRGNARSSGRHAAALLLLPLVMAQILFAAAAPVEQGAAAVQILGVREQCGGLLWSGSLTAGKPVDAPYPQVRCAEGLRCHRDSKWYYECVPEVDPAGAWKLEEALHTEHVEQGPVVQVTEAADSEPVNEPITDIFEDTDEQHEGVFEHYLKEGAEVIKSVFTHDEGNKAVDEESNKEFHQQYSLAQTLASWAHRRQMKTDGNLTDELSSAVGIKGKIDQFGQCGGRINAPAGQADDKVWSGAECWPGWTCTRVNQWYWQCQPIPSYSRPTTVVVVDGKSKTILDVWAQCGGKGGQVPDGSSPQDNPYPEYICFPNTNCTRQNEWYWQCLPNPGFNFGGVGGSPSSPNPSSPSPPPLYSPPAQIPAVYPSPPASSPPVYPGYLYGGYSPSPTP